jgi:two-component system nitrogen regulation response regulator NtrX
MTAKIYIIDDDAAVRSSLVSLLSGEGYRVRAFAEVRKFSEQIAPETRAILLLDIAIPGEDGLTFLKRCCSSYPQLGVIMITGEATIERAVTATRMGAHDFLEKPLDAARLLLSVKNLAEHLALSQQAALSREAEGDRYQLIGDSKLMVSLRETISHIAPTDSTVLITGENGTGKELVAYHLFAESRRARQPFVKVNCAALPTDLAEAELFGYRKGAFTGAASHREGKFRAADGGTILLDEIGDLSTAIQAKLLRILESGENEPLGSDTPEQVDVRLLAATNRDLPAQVSQGEFREDLYYRINVVPLVVPPLRQRRDDVPLLVEHFCARLNAETGLGIKRFDAEAIGHLAGLEYRGNVRELRNIVERCYIMTRGERISAAEVRAQLGELSPNDTMDDGDKNALTQAVRNFERTFLAGELKRHNGNIAELARSLGLDRGNLSRKLKSYGIV